MGFYLKLTEAEAQGLIGVGFQQIFGGTPDTFDQYTSYTEDPATGDKYWYVEDYNGYSVEDWIINNYPNIPRYDHEHVQRFLPPSPI